MIVASGLQSRWCWLLLCLALSFVWGTGCGGGGSTTPPPPATLPPTITKAYGAGSMGLNGSTSLTFHLANPNTTASLSGIGFTDMLPAGQTVSTPNGLSGACSGGTITATAGSTSVILSGAALTAGTSCTFAANITGTTSGTQNNTTTAVSSIEGGKGGTASASLIVAGPSHQPPQPTDISPTNLEVYYILNQLSGLQANPN